uniref:Uncharacterized protein n=1 Tax=Peronospora matthiolae TaxID=2874970 RepID=A0AAV1SZ24_9STRA
MEVVASMQLDLHARMETKKGLACLSCSQMYYGPGTLFCNNGAGTGPYSVSIKSWY